MNLNEVWYYDDEVDRWAAQREFDLREERYQHAREGLLGPVLRATRSFRDLADVLGGLDQRVDVR